MTAVGTYWSGAVAIMRRDLALFVSYRMRWMSLVFTSLFGLTLFHYISRLVTVGQFQQPDDYFAYVVIGIVSLTVLTSTLASGPLTLRQELVAGTFERLLVSPFGALAGITAMAIFPLLSGMVVAAWEIVAATALFGLPVQWSTAALAVPAALLGAISFLPFGLLISAAVITVKQAQAAAGFVVTGISLVAGLYFPVALLPVWIQWTSDVQPFTPAVELLRHLLVDAPMSMSPAAAVARMIGFTIVLMPLALLALRASIQLGRKRGTISEF